MSKLEEPCCSTILYNEVPLYSSGEENEGAPKPKRGRNKPWTLEKKFSNLKDAEDFLSSEDTWSRNFTRKTEEGQKRFYRCNKVKKKGPQCAAEVYLLLDSSSEDVIVFRLDADHNHNAIGLRKECGIEERTKTEINKLYDLRLKPNAILSALQQIDGIKIPTKIQLNNYLSDRRRNQLENFSIHLSELSNLITEHEAIPEDENKPFVIKYWVKTASDIEPAFGFVLTTKKLLKFACFTDVLHSDTTHKLMWQGFPVLVFGATDKNRKFNPICLVALTNEQEENLVMVFCGLKKKVGSLFGQDLQPKVLVCDGSQSIKNACLQVFGSETTIRMCWSNAKKAIQKIVEQAKKNTKEILEDVEALHLAPSASVFDTASRAFIEKHAWETGFINYFKDEWCIKNPNWFLGAAKFSPATNDALEILIKNIKNRNSWRERLPLQSFLTAISELVTQWSSQTPEGPSVETTIDIKEWTAGYSWAKQNVDVKTLSADSASSVYVVPSGKATDTTCDGSWRTFDEYKEKNFSFWKIELSNTDWKGSTCTCPDFFKMYMCRHILGLAIRMRLVTPPPEATMVPNEPKRKRGRPAKPKTGLIIP